MEDCSEFRSARTALDDLADEVERVASNTWDLRDEVSGWTAVAAERHAEVVYAIHSSRDALAKAANMLDSIRALLCAIVGLLAYIAYHLK